MASTFMSRTPLSLLDFCLVRKGETPGQSMERSVELAQKAERLGFDRIWYSEHHNMSTIASSSPAVLIAHIGAKTEKIKLGAGGVMLPNHAPYVIAEQFGTLAELYPGRIDLGVGRAPGTDQQTLGRALRRDPRSAENFPNDVLELQAYLAGDPIIPGVTAVPGAGTNVPIHILGSSMFGASLAAKLGLPYSFASHFAPAHLEEATAYYRANFQPSQYCEEPYVIAAVNVTAADSEEDAQRQTELVHRQRVRAFLGQQGRRINDEQLEDILAAPQGRQIISMLRYTAQGEGPAVVAYLEQFKELAQADELMISLQAPTHEEAMRSMEILANA